MEKRQPINTTKEQAAAYWSQYVDECTLSIDWSEATTHCWRCGCKRNLQRCHIIPDALGGKDEPSNIVLLCSRCHSEGPNVNDAQIMWDWIKAYAVPYYNSFWTHYAFREYHFIYRCTITQSIADVFAAAGLRLDETTIKKTVHEMIRAVSREISTHFGQPYYNAATIAGMYRMAVQRLAEKHHVQIPSDSREAAEESKKSWWLEDLDV